MRILRWEKDQDYVEITSGVSVDDEYNGAVWYIETNLNFEDLPIKFKRQVAKKDVEGFKELKQLVSQWAEENEYELASSDSS